MAQKKDPRPRAKQPVELASNEGTSTATLEEVSPINAELRDKLLLEVLKDNKAAAPVRPEPIEYFPYPEWIDGF